MATISLQNHLDKRRRNKGRHQPTHKRRLGNKIQKSWLAFSHHIISQSPPQFPEGGIVRTRLARNCGPEAAQ